MNTLRSFSLAAWCVALCAGFTLGLSPGTVNAAPIDEPPGITVTFSDLDLSKPAGAKILYRRIQQAARIVCEKYVSKEAARAGRARDCYETAVANAVSRVNRREVLAVHQAAGHRQPTG